MDLCDREAEMLNRGRSIETLSGLRQRLANLFLQFIETPDFNPEATRFLKVPPVGGDGRGCFPARCDLRHQLLGVFFEVRHESVLDAAFSHLDLEQAEDSQACRPAIDDRLQRRRG